MHPALHAELASAHSYSSHEGATAREAITCHHCRRQAPHFRLALSPKPNLRRSLIDVLDIEGGGSAATEANGKGDRVTGPERAPDLGLGVGSVGEDLVWVS